ncbi:glycoside hydrolase family protein [Paraburkholderia silviterrae]|uniref:Lysozyme n=1 Tax=Paraburkholderia silviterrae TaxID=2528715 RepID=A0A4V2ZZL2_9BURK|nr:glycoside hydrolase family protein [Paraburkholderia silviterrae]TDG25844.1 lysozyme [Paraburkholderia silviterrae]
MDPDNLSLLDAELRRDEGVSATVYTDTQGNPTCGVGHNLNASPLPSGWSFPLTDAQINSLLNYDLSTTFAALNLHLPWWSSMDAVRQRVIANMCFNMGIGKLLGFHNTLGAMQAGNYAAAASGMLASLWAKQVGARATRLAQAMRTDVMPDEPAIA